MKGRNEGDTQQVVMADVISTITTVTYKLLLLQTTVQLLHEDTTETSLNINSSSVLQLKPYNATNTKNWFLQLQAIFTTKVIC